MSARGRPPEARVSISGESEFSSRRSSQTYGSGDVSLIDLLHVEPTHATTSYLDQLVSLPLRELVRQPASIQTEASTVESDLVNLCFREHPTFISVHKCSAAVNSAFDDFSGSLGRLINAIPSLETECRTFASSTSSAQRVRSKAALVQEHQDKLLDLLELPQLMETCVRNGYYSEAMELLAHSQSLATSHPVAIVCDVAKEVEAVLQLMLAQLLALLREPVKLPVLVKSVAFLRRLNAIDEQDLGYVFLTSRLQNFRGALLHIEVDKSEPVRYVRKYIDLFREHVYDIIAQYTSIFDDSVLVTSFAKQCVTDLVELINVFMPRVSDPASMSSILVQLGYCAMSFARVGLDFSLLVGHPFASTVLASFSQSLNSSADVLATTLRDATRAVTPPSQVLTTSDHLLQILTANPDITHFPIFVALTNAHLTAFNSLRLLAPLTMKSKIIFTHTSSLLASTVVLQQYLNQAVTALDAPDRPPHSRTHSRTPSSPRAHLLQRNSDTQLTPEARAARRRETRRVCAACADVWVRLVVPSLVERLHNGIFGGSAAGTEILDGKLSELAAWISENAEPTTVSRETLKIVSEESAFSPLPPKPPVTPPQSATPLADDRMEYHFPARDPPVDTIDGMFGATANVEAIPAVSTMSIPAPADLGAASPDTIATVEAELEAMELSAEAIVLPPPAEAVVTQNSSVAAVLPSETLNIQSAVPDLVDISTTGASATLTDSLQDVTSPDRSPVTMNGRSQENNEADATGTIAPAVITQDSQPAEDIAQSLDSNIVAGLPSTTVDTDETPELTRQLPTPPPPSEAVDTDHASPADAGTPIDSQPGSTAVSRPPTPDDSQPGSTAVSRPPTPEKSNGPTGNKKKKKKKKGKS